MEKIVTIYLEEKLSKEAMLHPRRFILDRLIKGGIPMKITKMRYFSDTKADEFMLLSGKITCVPDAKNGSVTYTWNDDSDNEEGHLSE